MISLDRDEMVAFATAVHAAAGRAEVQSSVAVLYEHLQNAIELRQPICSASGRCCRFEEYGHRLFVTTMELSAFIAQLPAPIDLDGWDGRGCVYQLHGQCSVHPIRPFGCRVFFCDPTSAHWQAEQYERLHGELKRLHGTLGVPYFYVEWRQALRALSLFQ